jgi:hypothetical protein
MKYKIIISFIFLLILVSGLSFFTETVYAQTQMDWPASPARNIELNQNSDLKNLISYFYDWAISIGGMIVFLVLVKSGLEYLFSAGDPGKMGKAKESIRSAIIGLALLLSSFLILETINPELVKMDLRLDLAGEIERASHMSTRPPGEPCDLIIFYNNPNWNEHDNIGNTPARQKEYIVSDIQYDDYIYPLGYDDIGKDHPWTKWDGICTGSGDDKVCIKYSRGGMSFIPESVRSFTGKDHDSCIALLNSGRKIYDGEGKVLKNKDDFYEHNKDSWAHECYQEGGSGSIRIQDYSTKKTGLFKLKTKMANLCNNDILSSGGTSVELKNSETETGDAICLRIIQGKREKEEMIWTPLEVGDDKGIRFGSTANANSVVYGRGMFVVVGDNGKVSYSYNSIDWANTYKDGDKEIDIKFNNVAANSIAYGDNKFIVVGDNGKASYSPDGINWSQAEIEFDDIAANSIAYGDNKFIVVGDNGKASYSLHGKDWTPLEVGDDKGIRFGSTTNANSIVYGNGKFVVVGDSGKASYSYDGINWTSLEVGEGWDIRFGSTTNANSIVYGNGKFVVVGDSGKASYSYDGINWTSLEVGEGWDIRFGSTTNANSIIYDGRFVVVGDSGKASYSYDGINWLETNIDFNYSTAHSIAYGHGRFIVVGDNGKASYSIR